MKFTISFLFCSFCVMVLTPLYAVTTPVVTNNPNAVLYATNYTGADAGAQIQNAINILPPTGGIVDARGLVGMQYIGNSLTLGSNTKSVTLLLGVGTYYLTHGSQIFFYNSSKIIGVSRTATNIVSTGSDGAAGGVITSSSPIVENGVSYAEFRSFSLSGGLNIPSGSIGISLQGAWYTKISDLFITNYSIGIDINGTISGSYDNVIDNNLITGCATGIRLIGGKGQEASSNTISSNRIYGATTGIMGVAGVQGNLILRNDIEGAFPGDSYFIDYAGDASTIENNWMDSSAVSGDNFTGIRLAGTGNLVVSNEYAIVPKGGIVNNFVNNGAITPQIIEPTLGMVGINALPASPLYVKSSFNSYLGAIRIEGASSINTWSIHPFGSNETLAFTRNSGNPSLVIQAVDGNVGINKTDPQAQLDVNGDVAGTSFTVHNAAAHANALTCWTATGTIGYCSAVSGSSCTCNHL